MDNLENVNKESKKNNNEINNIIPEDNMAIEVKRNIISKLYSEIIKQEEENIMSNKSKDIDLVNIYNSLLHINDPSFLESDNQEKNKLDDQLRLKMITDIRNDILKNYILTFKLNIYNLYENIEKNTKIINELFYDYLIIFLILKTGGKIKYSPVDRIFIFGESEQDIICKILNNHVDIDIKLCNELKTLYYMLSMQKKVKDYEEKNEKMKEGGEKKNWKLSEEDYCRIILKKDFVIKQLEDKIENLKKNENNSQILNDLEKENENNKKEIEDMKRMHDMEFELMASAVYGLGINLFFNKEQQINEQINKSSSWLTRQKDYIMENKD